MTIKVNINLKKTYVFLVLDKSSSMETIRSETISHFNEQIQTIKTAQTKNMQNSVSLVTFSDEVQPVFFNKDVDSLQDLTTESFAPHGMTAMYDAVGSTIDRALRELKDIDEDHVSVLFVILSDGMENASKRYNQNDVAERIQKLQKTDRWTFTYIGANQDLSTISNSLNIPMGNILNFDASSLGVGAMNAQQTRSLGYYFVARNYGTTSTRGFYGSDKG